MWHWKRKYAPPAPYVRREILITKTLIAEWLWSIAKLKWKLPRRRTIDKRGKGLAPLTSGMRSMRVTRS
jgi:hypothetical protein